MITLQRRFIPLAVIAAVVIFLSYYHSSTIKETWRGLPQRIGSGDHYNDPAGSTGNEHDDPTKDLKEWNPKMTFTPGEGRPAGYNFSSMIVMATTKDEDTKWVQELIPEFQIAKYVADDETAEFHPPKNKGHEVMIYLTWLIDNYDALPDVAIFLHWHQRAWHNNDILNIDSAEMVKRLNPNRVVREGFMNLRCHWSPGCPDWMKPGATEPDKYKPEQGEIAKAWAQLFPFEPIPEVLGGMCCAQFALSADRIRALPKSRYVFFRDWLLRTRLDDAISGRVWEYMWHYIWTAETVHCPEEWICYCDGYGICFGGKDKYEEFNRQRGLQRDWERKLREWQDLGKAIEEKKKEGKFEEAEKLEKPEPGKDQEYAPEIQKFREIADKLREEAIERGKSPKLRAQELGRVWNEGDGF